MKQVQKDGNKEHKVEYNKGIWVEMSNNKHVVSSEVELKYNE